MKKAAPWLVAGLATALGAAGLAVAQPEAGDAQVRARLPAPTPAEVAADKRYSPPLRDPVENNLYWGDLHLHTDQSPDAFLTGTRAVSPEDAFRFAKGEAVEADNGMMVRLKRPYDFLAVTDHSEYLGLFPLLLQGDPSLDKWALGREWRGYLQDGEAKKLILAFAAAIQSSDAAVRTPAFRGRSGRTSPTGPTGSTNPGASPRSSATNGPR